DIAQVQVQNKLSQAEPLLPEEVQRQGVAVSKGRTGFLMVVGLVSGDGSMSRNDLADYGIAQLKDPLSRVQGVGSITVFGAQYSMRIWLQPEKLTAYG
ncbi:efflux RND transporter permease subunit, partial [Wenyingzhuangia sp. 1_MG-2023]|nr:efflux RND transporter permease subunit [Wenyingzhuangia sp. 1_MG-2023]